MPLSKDERFNNVKTYIEDCGYLLISTMDEYKNNKTKLKILCPNNHIFEKNFNNFQQGSRCQHCYGNAKKAYDEIYKMFINMNYIPLFTEDDYISYEKTKLPYICKEHEEYGIQYATARRVAQNRACKLCGYEKNSGINNSNWQGGITSEYLKDRASQNYINWRKSVYKRDSYTCQCCGDDIGGNLVAHHIENFADNVDLRFAIDNGITLCENCHKKFHKIYGYKNSKKEQFEEYLRENGDGEDGY